tara:strand:- start:612 stop:842 length:231 start_codon:yes stop_codon:yes gene_type:complete
MNEPNNKRLNENGLPIKEGVYKIRGRNVYGGEEIDVYDHPTMGLCCFSWDFHSQGEGHVPVGITELEFIIRVGDVK